MAGESNRKHGYNGEVLMDGVRVASVSKWTMNNEPARSRVDAFGDEHAKYVQGRRDMQGTIEGYLDLDSASPADGNAAFLAAAKDNTTVTLKLMPDADDSGDYFSGGAKLGVSFECQENGPITFKGTWVAAADGADWAGAGLLAGA
ncbi:MAG TPA: hypothetical protein VF422_04100 [Dokdonella sp.]